MTKTGFWFAGTAVAALLSVASFIVPAQALTVMQQCGQQYQAAKAGGTLNGMTWNQFRTDCAAKLKAEPAAAPAATPAPAAEPVVVAPAPTAPAPSPTAAAGAPAAPAAAAAKPASPGRAAMLAREKQCGAEWRAQKVSLIAQTPGLTWPKYWSQCNTRLKAAVQ